MKGLQRASRAVEKKTTTGKMLKLSTVSHKIAISEKVQNKFGAKPSKTIVFHS